MSSDQAVTKQRSFNVLSHEMSLVQLKCASEFLIDSIDSLGRWHCVCGKIMLKVWNDEFEQWEWYCLSCGADSLSILSERSILEAYNTYVRVHCMGNGVPSSKQYK